MTSNTSEFPSIFNPNTRDAFTVYLRQNPNNRRISRSERDDIVEWLTNPDKRSSSQKESSRRHYVRKTFEWDAREQHLLATGKTSQDEKRVVVTEDSIADVVEYVHQKNGHAGWDATWRDISSSYYGILRADLIFLLKRCQICVHIPSKQPKSLVPPAISPEVAERKLTMSRQDTWPLL